MPTTESGLEGPGIEPKPEVETIDSDKGFARALREQPGGDSLPASAREMGAPNSPHRKAWVQARMDEGQARAEAQITSKKEFDRFIIGPGAGNVQAGLELPDDSPPAPAPVVDTAEVERLRQELTATRGSLSEAQQHEATMLAYDALEESTDELDVHQTLSELRQHLPAAQWNAFKLDAIGGGLVELEELEQHEALYNSERAFSQAQDQATKSAAEMEALAEAQIGALEAEQKRLGMDDETFNDHLTGIALANQQLGIGLGELPAKEYAAALKKVSGVVAEYARAQRHADIQNAILGAGPSVENGLTLAGGIPANPREEITAEDTFDFRRVVASENAGAKVDIAAGVLGEEQKARSVGDTIAALARKADRDAEARQARAKRAGL